MTIGYMPRTIGYNRLHDEDNRLQSDTCQEQSVTIGYNRLHAENNRLQSVTYREQSRILEQPIGRPSTTVYRRKRDVPSPS